MTPAAQRPPPRVAVTGAAGNIGRALTEYLGAGCYPLALIDLPGRGLAAGAQRETVAELDLSKRPPAELFADVDVMVHLAGDSDSLRGWESLLPANIEAPFNVASAAMRARCRRLIVASSVHAVPAAGTARRPCRAGEPLRSHQVLRRGAGLLVRAELSYLGGRGAHRGLPNR